jgi:hypothetical protein
MVEYRKFPVVANPFTSYLHRTGPPIITIQAFLKAVIY